jgi:LemA protein
MTIVLGIVGGLILISLIWVMGTYNTLVRLRQYTRESWSTLDTELKRRYDLITNLVRTVQGYAAHERDVLQRVTVARSQAVASTGSPSSQAHDESRLVGSLHYFLAVVESYPDLKASEHFLELQQELVNTEDRIQAARRFYNANIRDLNTRIEVVPSNLIANIFAFQHGEYFEIAPAVRIAPSVEMS